MCRNKGFSTHLFDLIRMKRIILLVISLLVYLPESEVMGCTSAIVSAKASKYGRPMLWKHRDTSNTDNKVEYVGAENGSHSYVALFNASDKGLREAWTGMNDVGFAIMNTASYNIKDDNVSQKNMDKEGIVMTAALKTCRTVDDFGKLLDKWPRPIGVEANFGVIDASGAGAFFECNNHSYVRYDLDKAENGILIRTNYSHSGRKNEGYGFIREKNAEHFLLEAAARSEITPEMLTESVSRSFYHDLKKKDYLTSGEKWVIDQDFIPRYKSTAVIVIEGCRPIDVSGVRAGDLEDEYIMWTGIGYPPCSEIVPVWCKAGGVDESLRGHGKNGHSPQCDKVKARRAEVFPIKKGNGDKYINMERLYNEKGTGYIQVFVPDNLKVYELFRRKRENKE